MTALELEEIALNLDFDQSDLDDLSSDDDEDEVDLGLENVVTDPDDMEIADNMSDSSDEEPLAHYLPGYQKKWSRTRQFEPSQFNFQEENIDSELVQPIAYLKKYISDKFFEDIALFTNMREVADKGRSLETSEYEMRTFFGASMLIGIYGLPRIRMYWARNTRVPIISDNISRNRYFKLRSRLKLVEDQKISKEERNLDKFWKIRPMLDMVQKRCRNNKRTRYVSIDEQMIPFHGQVKMRQFVRGKPNPVGLKNFVMTTPKGVPLDFYIYEGKGSSVDSFLVKMPEKLDVGGRMVLKLTETLPIGVSVYTDRYFTSIPLIELLSSRQITLAGTIMTSRIPKNAAFLNDNQLKKSGRGSHDGLVREDGKIILTKWFDSRPVHFASSSSGIEPLGSCTRWSKIENKYITIKQPAIVADYNAKMGGVDLLDRVIGKYAMRGRTKKWTIRAIYHFFDFAVAASWLEYRQNTSTEGLRRKDTLDYLDFKLSVAQYLILTKKPSEQCEGNSEQSECDEEETPPLKQRKVQPVPDRRVRTVGNIHLPVFTKQEQKTRSKCRFPKCGKLTFAKCNSCNIYLCCTVDRNCFSLFHQ